MGEYRITKKLLEGRLVGMCREYHFIAKLEQEHPNEYNKYNTYKLYVMRDQTETEYHEVTDWLNSNEMYRFLNGAINLKVFELDHPIKSLPTA